MATRVSIFLTAAILYAGVAFPIVQTLHLSTIGTILSLWLFLFVLGFALSATEAIAFTRGTSPVGAQHFLGAAIVTGMVSGVIGAAVQGAGTGTLGANVGVWIERYGAGSLALRLAGASVAFMVTYCVLGSMVWPLVRPYYNDPDSPIRLTVPSGPTVIGLQLARGTVAILALVPLIASTSAQGTDWWLRFAPAIAVTMGVIPLLGAVGWPVRLRLIHGTEIVVFGLIYASELRWILRL